jgi:Na+-transporting NADH:ubiquinone oxidoreductase subunit NqrC
MMLERSCKLSFSIASDIIIAGAYIVRIHPQRKVKDLDKSKQQELSVSRFIQEAIYIGVNEVVKRNNSTVSQELRSFYGIWRRSM